MKNLPYVTIWFHLLSVTFQSMKEKAIKKKTDKQKTETNRNKIKAVFAKYSVFPFEKNIRLLPTEFLEDMCRGMSS